MSKVASKTSYHHGDLKQALLDETARLLREEGEEALSLRRLAANLGVSRTAPYNHFKNKEALLSAVAEEGFRRYREAMLRVSAQSRKLEGKARVMAFVKGYIDFARKNQAYYDLMYGSRSWRAGKPDEALAQVARGTLRAEIERLQRAQQRGIVNPELDVVRYAQVSWGTLHGISRLLLDGVYTEASSVTRLCESAADMLWQQIRLA